MIVKYEETTYNTLLIISETGKFLGECTENDFIESMEDRDSFDEEGYQFFYVDKEKLNFCFQSFSREKLNSYE